MFFYSLNYNCICLLYINSSFSFVCVCVCVCVSLIWNLTIEDLFERLLEISNDIVDKFSTNRDTD